MRTIRRRSETNLTPSTEPLDCWAVGGSSMLAPYVYNPLLRIIVMPTKGHDPHDLRDALNRAYR